MTTYYTLKDGTKISAFFWDDYYTGKTVVHTEVDVNEYDKNGNVKKALCIKYPNEGAVAINHQLLCRTDESGVHYIIWKGERINLENWDYYHISKLITEIKYGIQINDRWLLSDDMILASLMKKPDKFGVMLHPRIVQFIFPGTSIGITGEAEKELIPFIPEITEFRPLEEWYYKIRFVAQDPEIRKYCSSEEYYFDDFCSMLKSGHIKMFEL